VVIGSLYGSKRAVLGAGPRSSSQFRILQIRTADRALSLALKRTSLGAMVTSFAVSFFRVDRSFRGGYFFKGGRLPQAHGPFARARQIVAVRRKSEARNRALVPVKRGRFLHGSEIPQLDRAVVGAGGQRPAISRKGHIPDSAIVASQEPDISPVRLPKPDGTFITGAGNPFPIRGESDAINPSFVSFEHGRWARATRMPERQFPFLASDYECPAVG